MIAFDERRGWKYPDEGSRVVWLDEQNMPIPMDPVQPAMPLDWDASPPRRPVWGLRCKLCGLDIDVRPGTLRPILDKLHAAGVTFIELGALARILS